MEIIPAILPKDFEELENKCRALVGRAAAVHIDILDTTFALGPEAELPHLADFDFEAHLMLADPRGKFEEWVRAGVERVVIHAELANARDFLSQRAALGLEMGLGVEFKTPIADILPLVPECDYVHLMSIPELGHQGEKFEEGIFDKIRQLQEAYPEIAIVVDGGVNEENLKRLKEAGVTRAVVGSAIWRAEDPLAAFEDLSDLI